MYHLLPQTPQWVSGCRTKSSGLRWATDWGARLVYCTPVNVEKQWMLGIYMVCPVAEATLEGPGMPRCRRRRYGRK